MSSTAASVYRPCVVTFLDILGFREIVKAWPPDDIATMLRRTQGFAAPAEEEPEPGSLLEGTNWTRAFAFSDSIVRMRPYDSDFSEGSLFYEIIDLVHAQANLAVDGIFLRGGVSVGEAFFEESRAFGPGFVRAYQLESSVAVYPRIVVGPEVFEALRSDPRLSADQHDAADEIHYQKRLLRMGDDGLWFVDYLRAMDSELDEPLDYPGMLLRHRNAIISRGNEAPPASAALSKYLWLARYHNSTCRNRYGQNTTANLLIADGEIPGLDSLPEISQTIAAGW
jgi:hypothetical protein